MGFNDVVTAGKKLIQAAIQSPNYAMGAAGWSINADGSAEFQNVLVRGTITGSTIIGSTIVGGTITAGVLVSSNWVQNTTGWILNGTNASFTNAGGTIAANTIEIDSNFIIRGTGAATPNVAAANNGPSPGFAFNSGLAGEVLPGYIFGQNGTGPYTGSAFIGLQSPKNSNGTADFNLIPAPTTTGPPARSLIQTVGTTVPTGQNVAGQFFLGGNVATDTWSCGIQNTNKANTFVVGFGNQAGLTIGDQVTPGNRLTITANEICSYNASIVSTNLFLNDSSDSSFLGGVLNRILRASGTASGAGASASIASTTYAALPGAQATSVTITCPASGTIVVSIAAQWAQVAATVVGDFVAFSPNVVNNTQATTPFAATDTRTATWTAIIAGAAGGSATTSRTITISNCGNVGDSLTVSLFGRVGVANRFSVFRTELSVIPSL